MEGLPVNDPRSWIAVLAGLHRPHLLAIANSIILLKGHDLVGSSEDPTEGNENMSSVRAL